MAKIFIDSWERFLILVDFYSKQRVASSIPRQRLSCHWSPSTTTTTSSSSAVDAVGAMLSSFPFYARVKGSLRFWWSWDWLISRVVVLCLPMHRKNQRNYASTRSIYAVLNHHSHHCTKSPNHLRNAIRLWVLCHTNQPTNHPVPITIRRQRDVAWFVRYEMQPFK